MTVASQVLRDARARARLTQAELGSRANVPQSVVSAYESARREPSVDMLTRLTAAAGFHLRLDLTPAAPRSRLQSLVDRNRLRLRRELMALGASNIRIFGSVARGDDAPDSDVDVLVDVDESVGLFALGRMRSAAERVLGVPVDIVPADGLKADVRELVLAEAVPL
ncbi:MAG: nucleotidyltransferase domain-containing protein [Rhodoglobus sp.]